MNIRKITVAAIIALSATTAAFASPFSISVDPATVNAWVQLNVGSTAITSAKVDLSSLSIADQFQLPATAAATLDTLYTIVNVEGSQGLDVSLDNSNFAYCTELVSGKNGQQVKFNFLVKYAQDVNYGAHALKVTLENNVTHQQTAVILIVTVQ